MTPRDPSDLLADPAIARHVAGWPRLGDLGVVAESPAGQPVGACWLRFFATDNPGYGFAAPDIPEVSLAVADAWRDVGLAGRCSAR